MDPVASTADPVGMTYNHMDEVARQRVADFSPRSARFNPSGISKCARQLYYKHINTQPEFEEGSGFLSQYGPAGDFFHDQVRFVMRDAGCDLRGLHFDDRMKTVHEEDVCKKEFTHNGQTFMVSGRGDGRIMIDGEEHYLELKSINAYAYRWLKDAHNKGKILDYLERKYPSYIDQCQTMMALLGLKKTYLVVVDRSSCQFGFCDKNYENREGGIVLEFDEARWEHLLMKMAMVTRMAAEGTPPIQGHTEGSKDCGQCSYQKTCWEL